MLIWAFGMVKRLLVKFSIHVMRTGLIFKKLLKYFKWYIQSWKRETNAYNINGIAHKHILNRISSDMRVCTLIMKFATNRLNRKVASPMSTG